MSMQAHMAAVRSSVILSGGFIFLSLAPTLPNMKLGTKLLCFNIESYTGFLELCH